MQANFVKDKAARRALTKCLACKLPPIPKHRRCRRGGPCYFGIRIDASFRGWQLQKALGLTAATGVRFFHGDNECAETARRRQQFCDYAESVRDDPLQLQCAQVGAVAIFELIKVQLDDNYLRFPV